MKSEYNLGISSALIFDISLVHLDAKATDDELQDFKLLFSYPPSNSTELRLQSGLIEGLIQLGKSFGSNKSVEIIKTKFLTIALHEWETNLFVAMNFKNDSKNINVNDQLKNGTTLDFKLKNIVKTFATTFKLLHGSPRNIDRHILQKLLNSFLPAYLSANHMPINLSRDSDFIHTVTLSPSICLDIELFAAHLLEKHKEIKQLACVHSGHLVHQGIPLDDFKSIYNWLCLQVITDKPSDAEKKNELTPFKCFYNVKGCGYLIGLSGKDLFLPVITLNKNDIHRLSVLQYESLMLIMLLDVSLKYDLATRTLLNSIRESAETDFGGMKGLHDLIKSDILSHTELTMNYVTKEYQGSLGPRGYDNAVVMSFYTILRNLTQKSTEKGPENAKSDEIPVDLPPIGIHNASLMVGNTTITSKMDISNRFHIRM